MIELSSPDLSTEKLANIPKRGYHTALRFDEDVFEKTTTVFQKSGCVCWSVETKPTVVGFSMISVVVGWFVYRRHTSEQQKEMATNDM